MNGEYSSNCPNLFKHHSFPSDGLLLPDGGLACILLELFTVT